MYASRASSRSGTPAISSPSGRSVGRSLAEWTPRSTSSSSSARSISRTKRALSSVATALSEVLIVTTSAPPISLATALACARARALPRVPRRSGRSATLAATSPLVEGRDVRALPGFDLGLGSGIEPEELAQHAHPEVGVIAVGGALEAHRRLVQEPVGDRPGEHLDALAVGRREALPARGVLRQYLRDDRVGPLAQAGHGGHDLLGSQPALEPGELGVEEAAGATRLGLAARGIALDDRLHLVDVVEAHALDLPALRI